MVPRVAAQFDEGLIVRQLRFEGNHAIDDVTLAAAITTTTSSWFATSFVRFLGLGEKRRFNEREFRRDVERIRVLYRRSGYMEVAVDTVVRREPPDVRITFRIREGEPVRVASLTVDGVDSLPFRDRLLGDLPLAQGDPFHRDSVVATADTITTRLRDRGYPTATAFLLPWELDTAARTAKVALRVAPGRTAVVGDIRVEGVQEVDSGLVASLLATEQGRLYRQSDLFRSQRQLYRSELFRYASVSIDTARFHEGDPVVPLLTQVIEGRLHRAQASAGFGSDDCFRVSAGWTARNFLGGGRILELTGRLSKIGVADPVGFGAENVFLCSRLLSDSVGSLKANYSVGASLRRPAFLSPSNTLTLSAFAERRSEFQVYLRNDVGASVGLARETAGRLLLHAVYRVSYGQTEANAINFCSFFNACTPNDITELRKRRVLATLTASAQRERTNNPLDPSRGSILSTEATVSSPFIGSSAFQTFTRLFGEASFYRPIGRDMVLALRGRGGALFSPRVSLEEGSTNFVPPDQRFYAGGPNDVRGFNRNELGPVAYVIREDQLVTPTPEEPDSVRADSVQVSPTGGNTLAIANIELRMPSPIFGRRFRLVAFVDAGSVWEREQTSRSPVLLRITPGVGLRIATPLGPARMDVAYNSYDLPEGALYIVRNNGSIVLLRDRFQGTGGRSRLTLHFSVGQAF